MELFTPPFQKVLPLFSASKNKAVKEMKADTEGNGRKKRDTWLTQSTLTQF